MRAISLWQPWASLIGRGKKTETRSWGYKGKCPLRLAIHAANNFPPEAQRICRQEPYRTILADAGFRAPEQLPRGCIVAVCKLVACRLAHLLDPDDLDREFGNFSPGRFGWVLDDIEILDPPLTARGRQGLWEWDEIGWRGQRGLFPGEGDLELFGVPQDGGAVEPSDESIDEGVSAVANLNKVMLIGRLTRDPEVRTFQGGGKVASFGFAVNNRKKNSSTGEWEDEPVFLDCEAFNRGDYGKTADLVEKHLAKGKQCYLEGHLKLDKWQDKNSGENRQKLKVVVDLVQFLGSKEDANGAAAQNRPQAAGGAAPEDSYATPTDDDGIPF